MAWGLVLALLPLVARAEGPAEWCELYDARLLEVADSSTLAVEENLESLLSRVGENEPLRGDVAYWLANARLALGDLEGARAATALARRFPHTLEAATAFDSQIDAIERRITRVPVRSDFSDSPSPFAHSWIHGDRGSISTGEPPPVPGAPPQGNSALRWLSRVRDADDDQVVLTFDPGAGAVKGVRFMARAEGFPAYLRLLLLETDGHEFTSDYVLVPTDQWLAVEAPLGAFFIAEPGTARTRPRPDSVQAVHLQDVTGYLSADRGNHVIWIDNLEIW